MTQFLLINHHIKRGSSTKIMYAAPVKGSAEVRLEHQNFQGRKKVFSFAQVMSNSNI